LEATTIVQRTATAAFSGEQSSEFVRPSPNSLEPGGPARMEDQNRAVVAMSGGVDSTVAAYLMLRQGYEVIGLTMCIRDMDDLEGHEQDRPRCCGLRDVEDARRAAQSLGIPFYVVNLKKEFNDLVVEYFCKEYLDGKTPNPCIVCNEKLKFGRLWEKARALEAGAIVTGHYARVDYDEERGRYLLKKGVDPKKDQSYVLFSLSQYQLSRVRLPLGRHHKDWVRQTAREAGMRISEKADSQEICFVRRGDYRNFLQRRLGRSGESGSIVDTEGRVLGTHNGIYGFTIGQRRGLGVSTGRPLYVVHIDKTSNTVTVGGETETFQDRCVASRVNWIALESLTRSETVEARIRYNHPGAEATIEPLEDDRVLVRFRRPQKAVTPGQAVVFYQGDVVLGGGWIEGEER